MTQQCSNLDKKSGVIVNPIFCRTVSSCFLSAFLYLSSSSTSCSS